MKHFLIASTATLAFAGAGVAFAQAAPQPMQMKHERMAGPQTRGDVQAHVQAMFAKLDANRDGFIDKTEVEAIKTQMHARKAQRTQAGGEQRRAKAFDRIDANHDGNISRDEFASVPRHHGMMMRAAMAGMGGKMFDRADLDKDGRVSLAEAQQAALVRFDAMDLNHDGTVTAQERQQARQLRVQRKPA
jgi:Ca2+-binding EF-hand superfamily protein